MKQSGMWAVFLAGVVVLLSHAVRAESSDEAPPASPYAAIVDRNVFNLKPAPPPGPVEPPPPPPTKIVLLGIVAGGFGPKEVMFKTPVGTPPKETSYTLSVGQRDGDIEILDIDEKAGSVRLSNHGQEQTLTLEEHGMKPGGNAPPPLPGVPGVRIPPPGVPGLPNVPAPGTAAANPGFPPPGGGSSVTTFGAGSTMPNRALRVTSSGPGVPGGTIGGAVGNANTAQQPAQPAPVSAEVQMINMEVNRKLTERQVADGLLPPIPPTPLTGK